MIKAETLFKIGKFAKPHGVKGEISLVTSCSALEEEDENLYIVCEIDGIFVPFFVESIRYKTDTVLLVKLENIDTEDAVKEFSNIEVYYPIDEFDSNETLGQITWDNFVGYQVTDEQRGLLGDITDVDDSTVNVLFNINHKGKELLLPAVEEFILSIDDEKKMIAVSVPEGLFDLL
jgi:16S rRNA processing protein RimM